MKISDIRYASLSEVRALPPFDMVSPPRKVKWYLKPLTWLLAFPEDVAVGAKIHKHNMKNVKGPYLLLCNHNSFVDFKVTVKAIWPKFANYIVAVDGFIGREKLLRNVGCLLKRKFVSDIITVRNIMHSMNKNKYICAIYPEARYSLVGTTAILPDSLGKMAKMLKKPVVTLICHGHHLRQPVWNYLYKRKLKTTADMTCVVSAEEIETLSIDEINNRIRGAFKYDDYDWQKHHNIRINFKKRAEGLHKILYKCPHCLEETGMHSEGTKLWCDHCHKTYQMTELGEMQATDGNTEFSHIPDWYEWEREQVKKEIEAKTYEVNVEVDIDALPNSTGYYRLGKGQLSHSVDGFNLDAVFPNKEELHIHKTVLENYSVHVEFDYFGKGDGISFSDSDETFYFFPTDKRFPVTKVHFAVEELFKLLPQKNKPTT